MSVTEMPGLGPRDTISVAALVVSVGVMRIGRSKGSDLRGLWDVDGMRMGPKVVSPERGTIVSVEDGAGTVSPLCVESMVVVGWEVKAGTALLVTGATSGTWAAVPFEPRASGPRNDVKARENGDDDSQQGGRVPSGK